MAEFIAKFDPLKNILKGVYGTERRILDLTTADWLRQRTEEEDWLQVLFFDEVCEHLGAIPTMDEFSGYQCVYHPDEREMSNYLLRDRMKIEPRFAEALSKILDPSLLYEMAEAHMEIKVTQSRVAINFM